MRPTVEEQLQGTCRILEEVVAPCLADPLARTVLDGLVANLRMLTAALPAVPGFLRADNQAAIQLLQRLHDGVAAELATRIAESLGQPEPDETDTAALDARNGALRELLAQAVRSDQLRPEQHHAIVQYMTARASRVPMRYVPTAPSPPPTPQA